MYFIDDVEPVKRDEYQKALFRLSKFPIKIPEPVVGLHVIVLVGEPNPITAFVFQYIGKKELKN